MDDGGAGGAAADAGAWGGVARERPLAAAVGLVSAAVHSELAPVAGLGGGVAAMSSFAPSAVDADAYRAVLDGRLATFELGAVPEVEPPPALQRR